VSTIAFVPSGTDYESGHYMAITGLPAASAALLDAAYTNGQTAQGRTAHELSRLAGGAPNSFVLLWSASRLVAVAQQCRLGEAGQSRLADRLLTRCCQRLTLSTCCCRTTGLG
jgi:hypothetical protein